MISGIYIFTSLKSGRVYIGSSVNTSLRYNQHIRSKNGGNRRLQAAIELEGLDNFSYEVIEQIIWEKEKMSRDDFSKYLIEREQFYLDKYFAQEYIQSSGKDKRFFRLTFNLNPKASGSGGFKWSEESREKRSKQYSGSGHPLFGKKSSEYSKLRRIKTVKESGVLAGNNNPNYGKKQSKELVQRRVKTLLDRGIVREVVAYDKKGKRYGPFLGTRHCARELGLIRSNVKICLDPNYPTKHTCKGFSFKYLKDESNELSK